MKQTLVAIALAGLASTAFAQSSVTVYGRLNVTVERQELADGSKRTVQNNNASRLGFRGTEDMGGGLKAGFVLEHGFNVDTGLQSSGAFWGRQSEVFLSSKAGTLRLGNFTSEAYYATADFISMHNHDTGTSADALYAYVARDVNKISYRAPEFVKDLSIEVGGSLKEIDADHSYDAAVNYAIGPVAMGLGYSKTGDAQQAAFRVLFDASPFLIGAYIQRDEDGFGAGLGDRTTARISAAYMLGASEFHVNFGKAGKYSDRANSSAKQGTVAYNYNLSKRTKVYAYYTKVDDSAAGLYGDFQSVAVGMRHNF